jgi:TolB protein
MNRRTEDRLRAAFDAKAEQVTEDRLDRLAEQRRQSLVGDLADGGKPDDFATIPGFGDSYDQGDPVARLDVGHPAGSPRHARWFAPLLAAAAVVAVAVGVTAVSNSVNNGKRTPNPPATQASTPTPSPTPTPTPTQSSSTPPTPGPSGTGSSGPSATATPPAQTVQLGHGQQGDRSQVPWSQVGPGWTLAVWTPSTTIDLRTQGAVLRDVPESLFLVNPVGGRYLITTLPVDHHLQLEQWSGDGRRASFMRMVPNSNPTTSTHVELNLATGAWHEFSVTGSARFSYTKPLGLALLVRRDNGIERVSLDGSRQLLYPTTLPGGGKVSGALYTPDGSHLVRGTDAGWVVTTNDGSVVRTLARPDGVARCRFHRWWTDTSYLATCYPGPLDDDPRLWLLPITGETPTPLMAQQSGETEFADAIRAGSRTFLERDAHCGMAGISVLQPNGEIRPLDISGRLGQRQGVQIFQATRQVLYLITNLGCGKDQRVLSYDPRTDELTTLLGGSVNGGSILWALPYRDGDPPR